MKLRHPVVRGHPLHAMTTDLPIGIVPLALAASVVARARGSREAALAAGGDWLTIPSWHEARRPATIHGLVNTSATALVIAGALLPARRAQLLGLAIACMAAGAWLGGDLVYRLGWRVRPAELYEQIAEGKTREEAERAIAEHERNDTFLAPRGSP